MSRTMIVGREHLVGAHHDYDELMDMGAEAHEDHPQVSPRHVPRPHPSVPRRRMNDWLGHAWCITYLCTQGRSYLMPSFASSSRT